MRDGEEARESIPERHTWLRPLVLVGATLAFVVAAVTAGQAWSDDLGDAGCRWAELREGSGYEKWVGWDIADVRRSASQRDITVEVDGQRSVTESPGTVLSVSRCGNKEAVLVTVAAAEGDKNR